MNIGKMSAQEMIVWGLAVYGGYNLIKSQTDFLHCKNHDPHHL